MSTSRYSAAALFFALSVAALEGCGTTRKALREPAPARELFMEPLHIGIRPDTEIGLVDFDAATLFREGLRLHETHLCDRALVFYLRLLHEFSSSRYLSAAAFNAGRCLEELGRTEEAVQHYGIITRELPRSKDWVNAAFRESMCLANLGRHQETADLLDKLLDREDLTVSDRIDAMILLGDALLEAGSVLEAERKFHSVLQLFKEREQEEYLDPAPAARAEFRLAELAEQRFRSSRLRLPDEQMDIDLEAKANLLLETQAGYLRTIRHGDPEWATAASYRIGTLYLHLHEAMEQVPAPTDLTSEEVAVYRNLLRQRTGVLLRKALKVFEMTLELAERTHSENHWTKAAREQMARVENLVLSLYQTPPPEETAE